MADRTTGARLPLRASWRNRRPCLNGLGKPLGALLLLEAPRGERLVIDRTEAAERGIKTGKGKSRHPYAAIDHRVIDSPAFADLSGSAVRMLLILVRQLTPDNNGHLQATFAYCHPRGIGSEHTLQDTIRQLIAHGFIYRTRSHGANGAWARYAVTWLPIKKKEHLFLHGFVPCAWRNWQPEVKKPARRNCSSDPALSADSTPEILQKLQESPLHKLQTMN